MASLVVYVFGMGQAIYFREERAGGGGGGGGSENRKKRKVGEQVRTQGSMGRLYASPTYFWYLYNSHIFSPIRMKMVE